MQIWKEEMQQVYLGKASISDVVVPWNKNAIRNGKHVRIQLGVCTMISTTFVATVSYDVSVMI